MLSTDLKIPYIAPPEIELSDELAEQIMEHFHHVQQELDEDEEYQQRLSQEPQNDRSSREPVDAGPISSRLSLPATSDATQRSCSISTAHISESSGLKAAASAPGQLNEMSARSSTMQEHEGDTTVDPRQKIEEYFESMNDAPLDVIPEECETDGDVSQDDHAQVEIVSSVCGATAGVALHSCGSQILDIIQYVDVNDLGLHYQIIRLKRVSPMNEIQYDHLIRILQLLCELIRYYAATHDTLILLHLQMGTSTQSNVDTGLNSLIIAFSSQQCFRIVESGPAGQ